MDKKVNEYATESNGKGINVIQLNEKDNGKRRD